MSGARRRARRDHGLLRALGLGLSAGLLVIVAALAVLLIVLPKATGSTPLTVLTGSMEPGLPPGTLLVVRPTPVDQVQVGDVVTYQIASGRPEVVTHRVTGIRSAADGDLRFVLQGDANDEPDAEAVRPEQVRGVLWYSVPLVGWVAQAVTGEARSWIVPLLAAGLLAYAGHMVVSGLLEARHARRRGARHGRRRSGTTAPEAPAPRRGGARTGDDAARPGDV
ncbi:signal peptidase I [Frigoribacterium salinisoli]